MNKHDSRDYLHYKNRRTDYICYANCTVEAESALNSQSANNDKKQHKRERDRARYASMSQEQKNARNLRQREARKKKKGAGEFHICCSTYILPCKLHGSTFHQLVAYINTSICYVSCAVQSYLLYYRI